MGHSDLTETSSKRGMLQGFKSASFNSFFLLAKRSRTKSRFIILGGCNRSVTIERYTYHDVVLQALGQVLAHVVHATQSIVDLFWLVLAGVLHTYSFNFLMLDYYLLSL